MFAYIVLVGEESQKGVLGVEDVGASESGLSKLFNETCGFPALMGVSRGGHAQRA